MQAQLILLAVIFGLGGFGGSFLTAKLWKNPQIERLTIALDQRTEQRDEARRVAVVNQRSLQTVQEQCAAGAREATQAADQDDAIRRALTRAQREVDNETAGDGDALRALFERVRVVPRQGAGADNGGAGGGNPPAGATDAVPGNP